MGVNVPCAYCQKLIAYEQEPGDKQIYHARCWPEAQKDFAKKLAER